MPIGGDTVCCRADSSIVKVIPIHSKKLVKIIISLPGQSAINDAKLQTNMDFLFNILINAGVIFILASFVPAIKVKSYPVCGLGIFADPDCSMQQWAFSPLAHQPADTIPALLFVGILVSAVMIKLAARLHPGFEVSSWRAAFCWPYAWRWFLFVDQNL